MKIFSPTTSCCFLKVNLPTPTWSIELSPKKEQFTFFYGATSFQHDPKYIFCENKLNLKKFIEGINVLHEKSA